jgi:hypothetical protein
MMLAACEAEKVPGATKALVANPAKGGESKDARIAEATTALVNGEAAKGVARLTPGQPAIGQLSTSDGRMDNGAYVDVWEFDITQQSEVVVAMTSNAFDTYLAVVDGPLGEASEILAMNDDLLGTDSGLSLLLSPGTYAAMATSFAGGATGEYVIGVEVMSTGSKEARVLVPGTPITDELVATDPTLPDGSHYHVWTLQGNGGDRVTLTLASTEFDTYIGMHAGGEVLAENDDSDGTNSRLDVTLPAGGAYSVVVTSFLGGETGTYTLNATSVARTPFVGFRTGGDPNGRYALLVGIGDYPGQGSPPDLGNAPIEDANIMRRMLVDHFGFDAANVVMLTDADATRQNIAQGIAQHLGQAGPNGVAFFFYSGHGTQIGANIGVTGSLDPEPGPSNNGEYPGGDQALYVYGPDFESSVILDEELGYLIETLDAGRAMVAVDACFSGSVTRGVFAAKGVDLREAGVAEHVNLPSNFITSELKALDLTDFSLGFGDFGAIARSMENPQRHVMWGASTDQQVSWTSDLGGGSSVFAYYLGQRLTAAPGTMTLAQVHGQVSGDVVAYSRTNTELQEPQIRGDRQSMTVAEFFRQR